MVDLPERPDLEEIGAEVPLTPGYGKDCDFCEAPLPEHSPNCPVLLARYALKLEAERDAAQKQVFLLAGELEEAKTNLSDGWVRYQELTADLSALRSRVGNAERVAKYESDVAEQAVQAKKKAEASVKRLKRYIESRRKLLEGITDGPWISCYWPSVGGAPESNWIGSWKEAEKTDPIAPAPKTIGGFKERKDSEFSVASRTDVPLMLSALEKALGFWDQFSKWREEGAELTSEESLALGYVDDMIEALASALPEESGQTEGGGAE